MKNHKSALLSKVFITGLSLLIFQGVAHARGGENRPTQAERMERERAAKPEVVRWVGVIKDDASTHTEKHEHELKFVNNETGDAYDLENSSELVKLHHDSEKNLLVEIEAEKKPRFLFWGGQLVVKSFKVIREASEAIPHAKFSPTPKESRVFMREHGGGRSRI